MTKRDTIILAVLFNLVVLAGVLVTARQLISPQKSVKTVYRHANADAVVEPAEPIPEEGAMVFDEIDQLLEEYIANDTDPPVESPSTKKVPQGSKGKPSSDALYTIKPGDNPWKIAKKFHLSFEKLLQLNHLDEAKARNLKVGQQLKIKEE